MFLGLSPAKIRRRFYGSKRWQLLRRMVLSENPICQCGEIDDATGKVCCRAASEVHHVIDVAVAPDLAYCLSNLVALSKPCHSRETARRRS